MTLIKHHTWPSRCFVFLLLLSCLTAAPLAASPPETVPAAAPPSLTLDCQQLQEQLAANHSTISQEIRQLKREVAMLKQQLAEPGLPQIIAGLGYIAGLFGIAAFIAARRKVRQEGR